jgi:hypothetical protein
MNKRSEKITEFLKQMAEYASSPEIEFNNKFVYAQLAGFGETNLNCHYDLIRHFRNKDAMQVYYSEKFGDNFIILKHGNFATEDAIKLYIPFNAEKISSCSQALFDYIKDLGIPHQSKVAKRFRHDDIVIRVASLEDAKKIVDYVNLMPYLRENLDIINPFIIDDNGIGLAKDGHYSYNSIVSRLIAEYIDVMVKEDYTEDISAVDFANFVHAKKEKNTDHELDTIYDLVEISTKDHTDFYDFASYIIKTQTPKEIQEEKPLTDAEVDDIELYEEILRNAAETQYKKYGYNRLVASFEMYYKGNPMAITRDNNARQSLLNNIPYFGIPLPHSLF